CRVLNLGLHVIKCPQDLSPRSGDRPRPMTHPSNHLDTNRFLRHGRVTPVAQPSLLGRCSVKHCDWPILQTLCGRSTGSTSATTSMRRCSVVLRWATKNPDFLGFLLCQSPLTDSNRRPLFMKKGRLSTRWCSFIAQSWRTLSVWWLVSGAHLSIASSRGG